jgi:hypothetical protein
MSIAAAHVILIDFARRPHCFALGWPVVPA